MSTKLTVFEKLHFLERAFRYRYRTERDQLRHLMGLNLRGATVLDVGSNRGIYAYWLRKAVGPMGTVHAFEPQPELVSDLERLRAWLAHDNVLIHSEALSDQVTSGELRRQKVGDGGASLDLSGGRSKSNYSDQLDTIPSLTVATTTLDLFTDGWSDEEPFRFMKIDVEGHEGSVLKGAKNTLKRYRPMIQIELRVDHPDANGLIESLLAMGYGGWMFLDGQHISLKNYKGVASKKFGLAGHRDFFFKAL